MFLIHLNVFIMQCWLSPFFVYKKKIKSNEVLSSITLSFNVHENFLDLCAISADK